MSTSKILKCQVDAPCSTWTIRRYLNNEKIKHKKRIHCPPLTMKHKEKWLKYVHQYQTMSAKEWQKVVFSNEKKFNLDGSDGFQKYWHAKNFLEQNYSTRYSGGGFLIIWEASHRQENLDYNLSAVNKKAADYVKMLSDLSLAQEGRCLCGEEWIFFSKITLLSTMHQLQRSTCLSKK